MSETVGGSCRCGAVAFEVDNAFDCALICHCSQCRKATGAANKPFAGIERERLRLIRGASQLARWGESRDACDQFCAACGSLLWSVVRDGTFVHVPLGVLDDTPDLHPTAHIFTGSKAAWEVIEDGLPQHEEL